MVGRRNIIFASFQSFFPAFFFLSEPAAVTTNIYHLRLSKMTSSIVLHSYVENNVTMSVLRVHKTSNFMGRG